MIEPIMNDTEKRKQAIEDMEVQVSKKNDFADNKLRWDLLPLEDLEEVVGLYTFGAKKYSENSWQNLANGENRYRGAMLRHLLLHLKGEEYDKESGSSHLAAVIWNAIAMYHCYKNKGNDK